MRTQIRSWGGASLLLATFLGSAFGAGEDSETWGRRDTEVGPGCEASITLPEEAVAIPAVEDSLRTYADVLLAGFHEATEDWFEGRPELSMEITFTREPSPEGLLCLMAWIWEYSGGAHGMFWNASFVWDLEAGTFVDPVTMVGDSVAFERLAGLARDSVLALGGMDSAWVDRGTQPVPLNYMALLPAPDSLGGIGGFRVIFSPYQVGPYVMGSVDLNLPLP